MKRVSSAAVGKGRALNNTRVFPSQGTTRAGARGLAAIACAIVCAPVILGSCRRGSPARAPGSSADGAIGASATELANPRDERPPPPLPPIVPAPEELSRTAAVPPPAATATATAASPVAGGAPGDEAPRVTPANAGPARAPSDGGTLRVRLDTEPAQLNPLLDADEAALLIVGGLVYEPLVECPSPGVTGDLRPRLAESWQISADGLKITLKLRSGVRWHDGRGFGVLDVQATLEPLLLSRGTGSPVLKASLQDVASIEIAAEGIVRLNLKRASDFALRALCDIPILPDHLLRGGKTGPVALARQPVGTGSFRFGGWDRGKRIRLERWPGYWGEGARLAEIVFEIDLDGADALMRTRRGDIDLLPQILGVHYPDQVDATTLRGGELEVRRLVSARWVFLGVNHRHAPLGDQRLRHALSALWDREHLSQTLHGGMARPLAAPPIADVAPPSFGRAVAAAELEAAGYRDTDADGVREVDHKPVRVSLLVANGGRVAATEARAFVLEARKVGLLIDTVPIDGATLMARVRKGDFDLALMSWQGSPNEDPGLQFGAAGPFNYWGYRSVEVEGLLDQLRGARAAPARQRLLDQLAGVLAREQPVVFIYRLDVPALISRRVHDLAAVADRWDLRRVWVDR